jgi:hypothetical protein
VAEEKPANPLLKYDLSDLEVKIASRLSSEPGDIHTATARRVLGRDPSPEERRDAKAVNYGIFYGSNPSNDPTNVLAKQDLEYFKDLVTKAFAVPSNLIQGRINAERTSISITRKALTSPREETQDG